MRRALVAFAVVAMIAPGCGTTKFTDTRRTATEQLLIADAMDRAVSGLDFRAVAGKKVYLDAKPVASVTDADYLVSCMRQHMLASGCVLMDKREEADYIVELRAGAVGTDHRDVVFGVPATEMPAAVALAGVPSSLPEMPLAKKTEQTAVAKIAVFAYNCRTGRPVWQSGSEPVESSAKDLWVLGAGPFQHGTIYEGTKFAGEDLTIPLIPLGSGEESGGRDLAVADEAYFSEPTEELLAEKDEDPPSKKAEPAAPATKPAEEKAVAAKPPAAAAKKPDAAPDAGKVVPASHTEAAKPAAATPAASEADDAEKPATEQPKPLPADTEAKPIVVTPQKLPGS